MDIELSAGEWTLDTTASSVGFQAKAAFGMKVNGRFDRYESAITVGPSVAESAISAVIWTDSVDTGIKMRDEHLRADNVFAAARFPTLEFRSTAVIETPTGLDVTGTLRVRDISQSVSFHATRSTTAGPPRYNATVVVSPKEYGITRWGTTKPVKVILDATLKRA
ncbi:MAG: YceI family protein [Mycobacterium sp.]|uniref:YceI family protein n=1 Tax=Mycobacterium sp. TaxID=1785 RepID=UPI003BAF1EA4